MIAHALATAAITVVVVLMLYRRFRRLSGRQRVQPRRMKFRIGILALVGFMLLLRGLAQPQIGGAMALGLAAGVALAFAGLRWTHFENTPQGRFYTPHSLIGLALSALLIGRLAYRFIVLYPVLSTAHQMGANPYMAFQRSPLTTATFALFIGYYIAYYAGVLMHSTRMAAHGGARDPDAPGEP
jgi:hypothetical protein